MTNVYIAQIAEDWDMRYTRDLPRGARSLGECEVICCINSRETIVRLVDSDGGSYTRHALEGEKFDVDAIHGLMQEGWGINLVRARHARLKKAA